MMKRTTGFLAIMFCVVFAAAIVEAASLKAEISSTGEQNQASINKGATDGISIGMVFSILNDKFEKIGTFTVISAGEKESAGVYHITSESAAGIEKGMLVIFGEDAGAVENTEEKRLDIVIPADTVVELEMQQKIGSQVSRIGDIFELRTKFPIVIDGYEVIHADAKAYGEVTNSKPAKGYGKSGALEYTVKFVEAADGTKVPLSLDMAQKQKNSYAKAAVGTYLTGGLGGGAVKGKKINIEKGTIIRVFVPEDMKIAARVSGGPEGAKTIQPRMKKPPADTKVVFLGLNDSFNMAGTVENMALAAKISTFTAYTMQWESAYDFEKRHNVAEAAAAGFDLLFLKKGQGIPVDQRYNIERIAQIGKQFSADYVIIGDIIKYDVQETKRRDWLKTISALSGTAPVSALKGQVEKVMTVDAQVDILVYDVNRDTVEWNYLYKDFHQVAKPLGPVMDIPAARASYDILSSRKARIGNSTIYSFDLKNYSMRRSDDPIVFSATDEGYGMRRMLSVIMTELGNIM